MSIPTGEAPSVPRERVVHSTGLNVRVSKLLELDPPPPRNPAERDFRCLGLLGEQTERVEGVSHLRSINSLALEP